MEAELLKSNTPSRPVPSRPPEQVKPGASLQKEQGSAGGRGDGLLQLLAADLTGARLQEQVVAGVADQHGVVELLVGDGQLQVTAVFAEDVAAVPGGVGGREETERS